MASRGPRLSYISYSLYQQPRFNDIHLFKQEYKRLKFSISKAEYADQITQLRHCNQALARLTKQSIELEPTRSSRSRSAPNFGALQKYARNVFETLRGGLGCSGGCHGHSLKLRLERRHERLESEEDLPQKTQFRVIFTPTLRTQWQEAEIRCIVDLSANTDPPQSTLNPHPKQRTVHFDHISVANRYANTSRGTTMTVVRSSVITASGPTPNPIPKLCVALGHLHQQQVDSCLGYIMDSEQRKQGIFPIAIQDNCPQRQYMAYSLRQILADPTTAGRRLTQHDKLKVALELSSSTLQLYKTPWLGERWGEDDVYFVLKPGATPLTLYEHPYVHRQFSQSNIATPQTQQPKYRIIRNQTLYSLGILLIELWYGKSMEQLQAPLDVDCAGTPGVAWCTAERLVDNELEFEAGKRYSDAVRRCIRCDFDRSDMSLDNESFQQAVFEGVVLPLETTLQQFSGQLS